MVHNPDRPQLRLVHNDEVELPAVRDEQALNETLEGEVIPAGAQPRDGVARVITGAAAHQRTRAVVRHVAYVAAGTGIAGKRIWDARTTAPYRRGFAAALESGNLEEARHWGALIEAARSSKRKYRFKRTDQIARLIGRLPHILLGIGVFLLAVGALLAVAYRDLWKVASPFLVAADLVRFVVVVVAVVWLWTLVTVAVVVLLALWHVGRTRATMPAWLATGSDADLDILIDETTIAQALESLRIPQINAYLKQGLPLQFLTQCRQEGRGTGAELRLPGVAAEQIAKRRTQFAAGLYRRAQEVWLSTGAEAGILRIWAADKGALAEGAGPYPLLDEGLTDVFKGVPFGRTLRGDPLMAPVVGRNTIIAGMPEQGKSVGARTIMLGYALDPTAEEVIFVPDSNFDFEAFKPRCSLYVMGAEDEKIEQICLALEALVEEIQWRGDLLVQHQEEQVTRELASAGIGLHLKVVLLEEAHRAFGHKTFGQRISEAWETCVRLGRKRGVHMITSTQATTGKSGVPVQVTINSSNGICYAVTRWQENDAVLGQGAYSAGHRATDLIPGEDRGNCVVKGFTGERSVVAQAYYVSPSKGRDQVTPIIDRAMKAIAKRGRGVPGSDRPQLEAEQRDLLDDLDEVMGSERVRVADLPALLRDLAPAWAPYQGLTGEQLWRLLKVEGVRTVKTGNVRWLDPADLRAEIARRSTADLDDER